MTAETTLIKTAFENEGMSAEEIAECQELDVVAVKACLMSCSSKYRKECGREVEEVDRLNFSDDQLARVNEVIVELALSAEDPHLRFKAATYIRDDKKGRKEVVRAVQNTTNNVLMLNETLAKMRSIKGDIVSKALGRGAVIDAQ
jgi:hypothetical protein